MLVRNRVCFESDRGNRATRGKPVEQGGEEHTTNSNQMRQTPTVHSGIRTRVLRGDKRESNLVANPRLLLFLFPITQSFLLILLCTITHADNIIMKSTFSSQFKSRTKCSHN